MCPHMTTVRSAGVGVANPNRTHLPHRMTRMAEHLKTPIKAGWYSVAVECPQCGLTEDISMELLGSLKVEGEHHNLAVKQRSKAVEHECR
jgi:hypothetical protein